MATLNDNNYRDQKPSDCCAKCKHVDFLDYFFCDHPSITFTRTENQWGPRVDKYGICDKYERDTD